MSVSGLHPGHGVFRRRDADEEPSEERSIAFRRTHPDILDLPDEIIHYTIGLLLQSPRPRELFELSGRSLERAAEPNAFGQTCTRLRNIFRRGVVSLSIRWDDIVGTDVVPLFAPSLRHLEISKHIQSERFVEAVATHKLALQSLKLHGCPCDHYVLAEALRGPLRNSLVEFSMEYVNSRVDQTVGTTIAALAQCGSLKSLSIHGIGDLTHASISRVFTPQLEVLSLGYLRHQSIGATTLEYVAYRCTNLRSLTLHDTRWASAADVVSCVEKIGLRLRVLCLDSCRIGDVELLQIVSACPNIVSLAVRGFLEQTSVSATGIVSAVKALQPNLRALDVHHSSIVSDADVRDIVQAAPHLQELRLRNAHRLTNVAMQTIAAHLGNTLRVLDVSGTGATDVGMMALAKLKNLEAVHIGATVTSISQALLYAAAAGGNGAAGAPATPGPAETDPQAVLPPRLGSRFLTNAGVEELLRGCGSKLRRIQVESGDRVRQSGMPPSSRPLLGGESILRSVAKHCSSELGMVALLNLAPPLSQKVQRARMQLATIAVEDQCSEAVLYIDREPPELGMLSLAKLGLGEEDWG